MWILKLFSVQTVLITPIEYFVRIEQNALMIINPLYAKNIIYPYQFNGHKTVEIPK